MTAIPIHRTASTIPRHAPLGDMALRFSEADQSYIEIPPAVWFDGDLTIEAWVYVNSWRQISQPLLFFRSEQKEHFIAWQLNINSTVLTLINASSPSLESTRPVPLNEWIHVAATLEGATGTLFYNGEVVTTKNDFPKFPAIKLDQCYIAAADFHQGDGNIADFTLSQVRIWRGAMTAEQIKYYMHKSLDGPVVLSDAFQKPTARLIGNWKLNEGYGSQAFNYSDPTGATNGKLATAIESGGARPVWMIDSRLEAPGQTYLPPPSLSFTAAHQSYLQVPARPTGFWFEKDFSIEGWIYLCANPPANTAILDFQKTGDENSHIRLSVLSNGKLAVAVNKPNNATSGSSVPLKSWTHLAVTLKAKKLTVLIDGMQAFTKPNVERAAAVVRNSNFIGRNNEGTAFLDGALFDWRIWDGALSADQIKANMNRRLNGPVEMNNGNDKITLIANWRMDEGDGHQVANYADSSGKTAAALMSAATPPVPPAWVSKWRQDVAPDYALRFSPAEKGYIEIPAGIWFDGDFTIECWIYTAAENPSPGDHSTPILDFEDSQSKNMVRLTLEAGLVHLTIRGESNPIDISSSQPPLPANQWLHLAVTLKGTTPSIYMNGTDLTLSGSPSMNTPKPVQRTKCYLGRSISDKRYGAGIFRDLRIWQGALTRPEILANMHQSLSGPVTLTNADGEVTASLRGAWQLNAGQGTVAANSADLSGKTDGILKADSNPAVLPEWSIFAKNYTGF